MIDPSTDTARELSVSADRRAFHSVSLVRTVGNATSICCALMIAYLSSGLARLCGGYSECGVASEPVMLSYFAWAGLGGVVAAVGLRVARSSRWEKVVFAVTAGAYLGWLCLFVAHYV